MGNLWRGGPQRVTGGYKEPGAREGTELTPREKAGAQPGRGGAEPGSEVQDTEGGGRRVDGRRGGVARGGSAEAGGGSRSPGRICELSEPASAEGVGFPGPARPGPSGG